MRITFDPAKRDITLRERGLDFVDAGSVLATSVFEQEDARLDYREVRIQTVGWLRERLVMVVWTPRGEAVHVISMRKCNDREQRSYLRRVD